MYHEDDLKRIESIHKKLSSIYTIIQRHGIPEILDICTKILK